MKSCSSPSKKYCSMPYWKYLWLFLVCFSWMIHRWNFQFDSDVPLYFVGMKCSPLDINWLGLTAVLTETGLSAYHL